MGREVMWAEHPTSRRAHAVRLKPSKVREPSVRLSMCGRVAWSKTAAPAPAVLKPCGACVTALRALP